VQTFRELHPVGKVTAVIVLAIMAVIAFWLVFGAIELLLAAWVWMLDL
jgi:hypothetical protein